ncbi:MAG: hypothetical protein Q8M91_12465 [Polaromonas sp.]|nr:hypothetical protein [Polaromonas sp.]MDP3412826.1 hypothetical protein [Polaromonas sp.]
MSATACYLFTKNLGSLDLEAAEAAMAAHDFEVRLVAVEQPPQLRVSWQPDNIVHPDRRVGGMLDKPPAEDYVLAFESGEAAKSIRTDIGRLLAGEHRDLPAVLGQDCLVCLTEIDAGQMARHSAAMLYALLSELTATTTRPAELLVYEASSSACITPENAREMMNWRDMLFLLENPLPMGDHSVIQDPDFPDGRLADPVPHDEPAARQPVQPPAGASPGEQSSSPPWGWIVGAVALAAGFAAWYAA